MSYGVKGVPARFDSVGPTTAAKASSEGWRLCLRPNSMPRGTPKTHFSGLSFMPFALRHLNVVSRSERRSEVSWS
jgi:hypothetical protein